MSGQVTAEALISLAFLVVPVLVLSLMWFGKQLNRTECTYQSFLRAREQLIQTQKTVIFGSNCMAYGQNITEEIRLEPLDLIQSNTNPDNKIGGEIENWVSSAWGP